MRGTRIEHDALGEVKVPANALFGAHTVRALDNFPGSSVRVADRPELVRALAHVKAAAAEANAEIGALDAHVAAAIVAAAEEVAAGRWDDQFPLTLVQGGGGTSTNMTANEVIANRAAQLLGLELGRYDIVHPLDHVNRSQSTNDVYPTALQLAALERSNQARAALDVVAATLEDRGKAVGDLQRLGRTCLQDAVPLPVRAYHGAQAAAVRRTAAGLARASEVLYAVPLGGTVVGTGLGAPPDYRTRVVERLAVRVRLPLRQAPDLFDAIANLDPLFTLASAAAAAAMTLAKIAADLRFLTSGPVGGIAEMRLPAVQVGSSIMPGKINPVIPEYVIQTSFEIRGSAHVVESAVAAGELDLNMTEPVMTRHLLQALEQLADIADIFSSRCLARIEWNTAVVERHLQGSLLSAVERAAAMGYDYSSGGSRSSQGNEK